MRHILGHRVNQQLASLAINYNTKWNASLTVNDQLQQLTTAC